MQLNIVVEYIVLSDIGNIIYLFIIEFNKNYYFTLA